MNRRRSLRMRYCALWLLGLALAAPVGLCSTQPVSCSAPQANKSLLAALAGKSAVGHLWKVKEHPARVYLVSFVEVVPDTLATPSRTQSVSLSSMAHQFPGVTSILVDATVVKTGRTPHADELVNAWYDWSLEDVVLLPDPSGKIRQTFGACNAPESFLLRSDGTILEHWNDLIPTGTLALAIERVLPDEAAAVHASHIKKKPNATR